MTLEIDVDVNLGSLSKLDSDVVKENLRLLNKEIRKELLFLWYGELDE